MSEAARTPSTGGAAKAMAKTAAELIVIADVIKVLGVVKAELHQAREAATRAECCLSWALVKMREAQDALK